MGDTLDPTPFPAEADLAAVANIPLGPVGRFQIVAVPGEGGVTAAFVLDTTDGRSWRLDRDGADRWVRLDYEPVPPAPAP